MDALDTTMGFGRPAWMKRCQAPGSAMVRPNTRERNSEPLPVITRSSHQPRSAMSWATRRAS